MFVVDDPTHPFALTGLGCWTGQWGLSFPTLHAAHLLEQNGGFSYLQEKALQRILKITWFEHLAHTIPPAPLTIG